jgi:hypothetical protein
MAINSICLVAALCQILNDGCQLLLEYFDALLDDDIGLQVSYTLDLEVESLGDGIVIKWFPFLRGFLPLGIFAFWPSKV